MRVYLHFLQDILDNGMEKSDRTSTGIISVFARQLRFDLTQGFPLVTTKKIHTKSIIHELLWFLRGDTNVRYLQDRGVSIWNEWADEQGDLGPIYGKQWRSWEGVDGRCVDQIQEVISQIKSNPNSRRLLVSAWNVSDLPKMRMQPCHTLFQFYVVGNTLSCQLYQRSADAFLGVPFNIASYALLTHMIAQQCDLVPGEFIWTGGDCHIYKNHIDQVKLQLSRDPHTMPSLIFKRRPPSINDYQFDDIEIINYHCHPTIKGEVAV